MRIPGFNWLLAIENNPTIVYCIACDEFYKAHKGNLVDHGLSGIHEQKMREKNLVIVNDYNLPDGPSEIEINNSKAEIKFIGGAVRLKVAFCNIPKHVLLNAAVTAIPAGQKGIWEDMKTGKIKARDIIVNVIAKGHKYDLIEILKKTRFSIATDESTDYSKFKLMVIVVSFPHRETGKKVTRM